MMVFVLCELTDKQTDR